MGFFSWKTQDTNRSIANYYSDKITFKVVMTDNKGNKYIERNYEGYGVFGGRDFYELLAEMNGYKGDPDNARSWGIDLAFSGKKFKSPNLSESEDWKWVNVEPETCEFQGYFY